MQNGKILNPDHKIWNFKKTREMYLEPISVLGKVSKKILKWFQSREREAKEMFVSTKYTILK